MELQNHFFNHVRPIYKKCLEVNDEEEVIQIHWEMEGGCRKITKWVLGVFDIINTNKGRIFAEVREAAISERAVERAATIKLKTHHKKLKLYCLMAVCHENASVLFCL